MATILVVEDEEAIQTLLAVILRLAEHKVLIARNGVEGIALFRSSPDRFDIILTDLVMPVMDGHQLVKLVRETRPRAKIICMSGYTDMAIPANTEFLQKPFTSDAVHACVNKLLRQT